LRRISLTILRIGITILLAGIFGVVLVRLSPGYGVDEAELNPQLDSVAVAALRAAHQESLWVLVPQSLSKLATGEWGVSTTFRVPVRQLLSERWAATLASVTGGLALAWILALLWTGLGTMFRWLDVGGSLASFGLLSMPAGLVAIAVFLIGAPVAVGIAIAVFPQIFRYTRQLAFDAMAQPCIFAAAARGVSRLTVLVRHAGALMRPQAVSLLGASAATAVGAAIPMEALCDSPGLGQLAWKAALARDLALLLPLILIITAVIQIANGLAELTSLRSSEEGAA
jgi:peptide/nickel transport system permease protein